MHFDELVQGWLDRSETSPLDRRENLFEGARILVSSKDTPCAVGRGEKPTERSSLRVGEAFEKLSLVRRRCRREPKTESSFACRRERPASQLDALSGAGNAGGCISQALVWFPGQQDFLRGDLETGAQGPGGLLTSPGAGLVWRCFQFLSELINTKAGGGNYILFVHRGRAGSRPAEISPNHSRARPVSATSPLRRAQPGCPPPARDSWPQSKEKGGVRRAGWELHFGKPSFESTFFSKPQTQIPK